MSKVYTVLTGDLVGSTELSTEVLVRARDALLQAAADVGAWEADLVKGEAEFFRGDSWQLLLTKPRYFLRVALYLRAALRRERKGLDTRIGVGFGDVERIDAHRISLSVGDAFTRSGRELDRMGDAVGVAVALPDKTGDKLGWIQPMTTLCSVAMNHWSERQADIATRMLVPDGPRQADVASALEVTRQMVSKTLVAIEFSAIESALEWVEGAGWVKSLRMAKVRFV